jgi:transposase
MQHYVGLDVSVKETSVCIVDKAGKVIREVKVATKPAEILAVLTEEALAIERIGLEAGPLSQWLYSALAEAGLPVICVETRHMKAALSAQINKSDRNDARASRAARPPHRLRQRRSHRFCCASHRLLHSSAAAASPYGRAPEAGGSNNERSDTPQLPTRQAGRAAKNSNSFARVTRLRITSSPLASTP